MSPWLHNALTVVDLFLFTSRTESNKPAARTHKCQALSRSCKAGSPISWRSSKQFSNTPLHNLIWQHMFIVVEHDLYNVIRGSPFWRHFWQQVWFSSLSALPKSQAITDCARGFATRRNVWSNLLSCKQYHALWLSSTSQTFWKVLFTASLYFSI